MNGVTISLTEGAMLGTVSVSFTECVPTARGQDNPASFATSHACRVEGFYEDSNY